MVFYDKKFSCAVEKYLNCQRCFILQYKHKVSLRSLPFSLNSAVDNLCKNEFDYYRQKQEPHPLFIEHNIDAVPFKHPDMERWRNFRQGIDILMKIKGIIFMEQSMMFGLNQMEN